MRTHKVTRVSYATNTKLNFENVEYNIMIVLLKTNHNFVNSKNLCFKPMFRNTTGKLHTFSSFFIQSSKSDKN